MSFNSSPGNTVRAGTTTSATGGSNFPTLQGDPNWAINVTGADTATVAEIHDGYLADGDFFRLPDSGIDGIEHHISSGALQFTINLADVDAAIDNWLGFTFIGNLLYGMGIDLLTVPNSIYTFTVNSSGTVVVLGGAGQQLGVDFDTDPDWDKDAASGGGSSIQQVGGTGNLFLRSTISSPGGSGTEEVEINISTGAIVSQPTRISPGGAMTYKTANGFYCSVPNSNSTNVDMRVFSISKGAGQIVSVPIIETGPGNFNRVTTGSTKYGVWKNKVSIMDPTNNTSGPKYVAEADFDTWIETVAKNFGMNV